MSKLLLVVLGGGAGAAARYAVGSHVWRLFGTGWPFGTFICNLLGGLAMGLLVGFLAHRGGADQDRLRLLFGVGVLGGFTTFSAFSLEIALMIEKSRYAQAFTYVSASVLLSVAALFAGLIVARRLFV